MSTGHQSLEGGWKIKGIRKPYGENHTAVILMVAANEVTYPSVATLIG